MSRRRLFAAFWAYHQLVALAIDRLPDAGLTVEQFGIDAVQPAMQKLVVLATPSDARPDETIDARAAAA